MASFRRTSRRFPSRVLALATVVAAVAAAPKAPAADYTFDGAFNSLWYYSFFGFTNWTNNLIPESAYSTNIYFGAAGSTGNLTSEMNFDSFSLNSLNFRTTGSVSLSGNFIRIGGGGSVNAGTGSNYSMSNALVLNGNGAANNDVTFNTAGTLTSTGLILGAGKLVKTGNGTLVLAGGSTYTGGTTVSAGRLIDRNPQGNYTVSASGTLEFGNVINRTFSGAVSGTGTNALVKSGSGNLTLTGSNTYGGATVINGGTLTVGSKDTLPTSTSVIVLGAGTFNVNAAQTVNSISGSGAISVGKGAALIAGDATNTTFSGTTSGEGMFFKRGTGVLTLSGQGGLTGLIEVNAGTLRNGGDGALGTNSPVGPKVSLSLKGGNYDLNGFTQSVAAIYGSVGSITLWPNATAGSGNLTIDTPDGVTGDTSLPITGRGTVTKTGPGTQILRGADSYDGGTKILDGTLVLQNPISFFPNPAYTVNGSGILEFQNQADLVYANSIVGTGTFAKSGSYNLTLDRLNSYSGGTIVKEGTLTIGGSGTFAKGPLTVASGAAFVIGFNNATATSLSGGGTVSLAGRTLTIDTPTGVASNFSGSISGTGGVGKSGVGTQTLSGTSTSTASLSVNAGTLVLSGSNAFSSYTVNGGTLRNGSSNALQTSKGLTVAAAGAYDLAGHNQKLAAIQSAGSITLGSGALEINQGTGGTSNISGAIGGSGSLAMIGEGVLNLSGLNSYTGGTTVYYGRLIDANPHGDYSLFNSNLEFRTDGVKTYAGAVTYQGTLTKSGGGTLTLTGANDYYGGTFVTGGRLIEPNPHGPFYNLTSPGVLEIPTATDTYIGLVLQGSGGFVKSGPGTLSLAYYSGYAGNTGGTTVEEGKLVDPVLHNNYLLNGTSILESANPNAQATYSGVISGTGSFVKSGSGTLTLTNRSNYGGGTIVNEGTLKSQGNFTLPGGVMTVNAGATYDTGAGGQGFNWISGLGNIAVNTPETNPLTITLPGGTTNTFDGTMNGGGGALSKVGDGTLVLTGAHSFGELYLHGGRFVDYKPRGKYFIDGGTVLEFANAGDAVLNSFPGIRGAGAVVKSGAGTLTLGDNNSEYTGGTTITGGRLIATNPSGNYQNDAALEFNITGGKSYSGKVTGNGSITKSGVGTLTVSGTDSHLTGYTVTGGLLNDLNPHGDYRLADGNLQFQTAGNITYGGLISGTGSLTKYGGGVVTLSQPQTYAGKTHVYAGGFSALVDNALPATGGLHFVWGNLGPFGGSSGSWSLNGHHQDLKFLDGDFGNVDLGNGGSITVRTSAFDGEYGDAKMDGPITGAGSFTMIGDGTQILRGINTYTGGTTVTSGRLVDWNPHGDYLNNAALEFRPLGDQTFSGVVSGTGSLTKSGTGNLTLAGMDTYTGGTSVLTGRLTVFNPHGAYALANGTTLEAAKSGDYALAAPTGTGSLVKSGAGTLTLGGTNPYTGNTAVNAGTLKLDAGLVLSAPSSLTVDAGATFDMTDHAQTFASIAGGGSILLGTGALTTGNASNAAFSGAVSGGGSLTKVGAGTLTLSGANSYSGGTNLNAGKLIDANPHGNYVDNAALEFATATDQSLAGVVSGTGSLTKTGAGTLVLSGANTYSGGTAVTGGRLVDQNPHGTYALTNAGLEFAPTSGLSTATVTGSGTFIKSGAGTVAISGTLGTGIAVSLTEGTLKGATDVFKSDIVSTGGTLQFDQTVKGGTYSYTYSGSGSILKTGSKPLTMGSVPVNTGGVRISGGSLGIGEGGAFGGGLTVDRSAAFLNFSGDELTVGGRSYNQGEVNTLGGSTTVFTGLVSGSGAFTGLGAVDFQGGYAPGNSPASVTFQGDVNLSSTLTMELGGTALGTEYDHLNVLGTAFLGGDLVVAYYGGFSPALGQSFDLFDFNSSSGTFASVSLPTLGKSLAWNTSMLYTNGTVSVQAVPEPASLAALGLGALALLKRRRR